jgi:hypothetical protein
MKYHGYVYCISCQGLFDEDGDKHAREHHDVSHAALPRVSSLTDDHYVASYDSTCTIMCNFKHLGDDVEVCGSCHAIKVPHDVADPRENESHLQ